MVKHNLGFFSIISFFLGFLMIAGACSQRRNIVPNESDYSDISVPLSPNEDQYPDNLTFGEEKVPGFSLNIEMPSDSSEVYISISRFIALETHNKIIEDLLEFIESQLDYYGFLKNPEKNLVNVYKELMDKGDSQQEAVQKIFDLMQKEFENNLPEISYPGVAFNISFDIYPVYLDNTIVTYFLSAYSYTGGAHGNTTLKMKSYELKSGDEITLEMIVREDAIPQVRDDVAAHMAYSYPIYDNIKTVDQYIDSLNSWLGNTSSADEVNTNHLITLNNFPLPQPALNDTGLVFIYPMYELTPGSDGCPVVVLSYAELKGCLNPQFTK